jgi:hypothetical protein
MRFLQGALAAALLCWAGLSISGGSTQRAQSRPQPVVAALSETRDAFDAPENDQEVRLPTTPDRNSRRAWKAEMEAAGRSWQEGYCQWALAHDLPIFPAPDSDNSKIARGNATKLSVSYFVAGAKFNGACRFTSEGRAVPVTADRAAPLGPRPAPTGTGDGHWRKGALLDGLEYASTDDEQLASADRVQSESNTAWFSAVVVSVHGEPLHSIADGYVPRYAYHSHAECMAATRQSVQPMAVAGIRGRFMCMYHGESDREISRLPMKDF